MGTKSQIVSANSIEKENGEEEEEGEKDTEEKEEGERKSEEQEERYDASGKYNFFTSFSLTPLSQMFHT